MRIWIAAAAAAVFLLAWTQLRALAPQRQTGILTIDPPTHYFHYTPRITPRGRVLVVHGLDSSKEIMQVTSEALADGGFEVYAIDLPGHSSSPVGFEATLAQKAIWNALAQIGKDSIVLGHSLGAGLLLDLAQDHHFSTMVLVSPPPTPVSKIQADRVLLISGVFDIARIRSFAPLIADLSPNIELWQPMWAAHSSAIFNPVHVRRIVDWLGGAGDMTHTTARLFWLGVMIISGVALGITLMPARALEPLAVPVPTVLVRYVAACGMAILTLKIFIPMSWIRLFATDYLVSFLLVTGLALWIQTREVPRLKAPAVLRAAGAAVFVIVVLGFIAGSHVLTVALSDGRWWRFPCLAAAGLPLFNFDEMTIRRIHPRWKAGGVAIITRILLWVFLLTGVLLLNRRDAFLVLIAHLMVLFWIALWLATGVVHKHTQDPFAAALFASIVQGWAFAAWFVTI